MMEIGLKKQLFEACQVYVELRLQRLNSAIADLEEALKLETKCSMGDKYETGRAMLHLEFEKLSAQHEETQKLKKTLSLCSPQKMHQEVGFGSVVKTDVANYFIAIPAGELVVEQEKFYAVGATAPVAKILFGKKAGEKVIFNGKELKLLEIL